MALVERLMRDPSIDRSTWIAVHDFFAAMSELERGALTVNQIKTFLNMSPEDEADFDSLISIYQTLGTKADQIAYVNRMHAVFILARGRQEYPGYTTPDEVRTKLGI